MYVVLVDTTQVIYTFQGTFFTWSKEKSPCCNSFGVFILASTLTFNAIFCAGGTLLVGLGVSRRERSAVRRTPNVVCVLLELE